MQDEELRELAAEVTSNDRAVSVLRDGSGVVLDLPGMSVLSCNQAAMFIVNALRRGVSTVDELVSDLVSEFDVDRETAEQDLGRFLNELARALRDPVSSAGRLGEE